MEDKKEKIDIVEYRGKEYEVKYLQESKYGIRGEHAVAYIDIENGYQLIAKGERSPKDKYSIEQAKICVLGRLKKKIRKRKEWELAKRKRKEEAKRKGKKN